LLHDKKNMSYVIISQSISNHFKIMWFAWKITGDNVKMPQITIFKYITKADLFRTKMLHSFFPTTNKIIRIWSTQGVPFSSTASGLILCGSGAFSRLTLATEAVSSLVLLVSWTVLVSSDRTASSAFCGSNPQFTAAWVRTESCTASPSTVRIWSKQEYSLAIKYNT